MKKKDQLLLVEEFCKMSLESLKQMTPEDDTRKVFYEGCKSSLEGVLEAIKDIREDSILD